MEKKKFIKLLNLTLSSFAYWFLLGITPSKYNVAKLPAQFSATVALLLGLVLSSIYLLILLKNTTIKVQTIFFWSSICFILISTLISYFSFL